MTSKEFKCLFLIIIIFIAACIETDIYLPAFPDMISFFEVSEDRIQHLLTWNFLGICLSCPFYGPISDAIGRKKPLIVALSLFFVGSLMTIFAHNFEWMLWGRVLQGLGSGGCFTLGTAIIFDAFQHEKAIQAMNKLNTIIPFIMALAPMLGGYLNHFYGFRSNFLAIALFVFVSLAICFFYFEETLDRALRTPLQAKKLAADFKRVLLNVPFWQTTTIVSLGFGGYLAFLSTASVLFVMELGVSKQALPFFQASLLVAWLCSNQIFNPILKSRGNAQVKKMGTFLMLLGGLGMPLSAWIDPQDPYLATAFMIFYTCGANWIFSLFFPESMEIFPDIKGIAASLTTSIRLLFVALIIGLTGRLYNGTIYPTMGIIFGLVVLVCITILFYEKRKPQTLVSQ